MFHLSWRLHAAQLPYGTAPGLSGFQAQHVADALGPAYRSTVVEQFYSGTFLLARGAAQEAWAPCLAGANLVAADKKDGGVWPIAARAVLRRLTANCLGHTVKNVPGSTLWPLQAGCSLFPLVAAFAVHVIIQ